MKGLLEWFKNSSKMKSKTRAVKDEIQDKIYKLAIDSVKYKSTLV